MRITKNQKEKLNKIFEEANELRKDARDIRSYLSGAFGFDNIIKER